MKREKLREFECFDRNALADYSVARQRAEVFTAGRVPGLTSAGGRSGLARRNDISMGSVQRKNCINWYRTICWAGGIMGLVMIVVPLLYFLGGR